VTQPSTVLTFRQTIQQAFRGVSDALVEYPKEGVPGIPSSNWHSRLKTRRNSLRCAVEVELPVTSKCSPMKRITLMPNWDSLSLKRMSL
jgi:hypothetical protein